MRLSNIFESSDEIPYDFIVAIQKTIKTNANDANVPVLSVLPFVNGAFKANNVAIPNPSLTGAWRQYEDMITYAVDQLQTATNKHIRDNSWQQLSASSRILGL